MSATSMLVGFGREPLRPPVPFDPQGQVARVTAVNEIDDRLSVTACVIRSGRGTLVIVASDVLAHTSGFAKGARRAIGAAVGCADARVLLNASHTHASLWPGRNSKVSGSELGRWWPGEREYIARLPEIYASAARRALADAAPSRTSWSTGRVPGRIGSRRQRLDDGRIVIGLDTARRVDDTVAVLRFDDERGRAKGTIVCFACHPVVLGHEVPRASPDFVGSLRTTVEAFGGGMCLFLQGASGDVQPREALHDHRGPEDQFGARIGLEAAHASADADPWPSRMTSRPLGRWTPTIVHRSERIANLPPQRVAVRTADVRLPLSGVPSAADLEREAGEVERRLSALGSQTGPERNALGIHLAWLRAVGRPGGRRPVQRTTPAQIWAARVGDAAIVGVSAELFGDIGASIRAASPAACTIVAGCCNDVLGYLPTAAAIDEGGFEVTTAHRIYGAPAAVAPAAGDVVSDAAARLLRQLFADRGSVAVKEGSGDAHAP